MAKPFPGKWTFKYHPWLKEMHDCTSERMVGQKAAQMGFTECALNKTFYAIDVEGESVLYILPVTNPDASNFSTSRFDPALEMSPHLSQLFTDVKNIGHKRAGSCNLFIRGSRSRSQLKSIPAGRMIFDEVDEMVQDNIVLAFERMSGQKTKQAYLLSTPTKDGFGINAFFQASTQEEWFFHCPHCNKMITLTFPECIVITAENILDPKLYDTYYICPECKKVLDHEQKPEYLGNGEWVAAVPGATMRGFHINQMFSPTAKPYEIAELYLNSMTNPADEQEFYNSKLGLTHVIEGAQVSDADIEECTAHYKSFEVVAPNKIVTMGIDVGRKLDVEIDLWDIDMSCPTVDINIMAHCRMIKAIRLDNFDDLDRLMFVYGVKFAVIDRNPETRSALSFARRHPGRVALCQYIKGITGRVLKYDEANSIVSVDRTTWMDLSLGRFIGEKKRISLPVDTSLDYKEHIKAPARIYKKDNDGNVTAKYVTGTNEADHFAHARNYAEIALPLAAGLLKNEDIGSIYG